jgi:hypothetical protein
LTSLKVQSKLKTLNLLFSLSAREVWFELNAVDAARPARNRVAISFNRFAISIDHTERNVVIPSAGVYFAL